MNKHRAILCCIAINLAPSLSLQSYDATNSIRYVNHEAEQIVRHYLSLPETTVNQSKALDVCYFLRHNPQLSTFPANTTVTINNRQYRKENHLLAGLWFVVLPEKSSTIPDQLKELIASQIIRPPKPKEEILFFPRFKTKKAKRSRSI